MTDHFVVFTPSGKRGNFAHGTSVLAAARTLGVDLDSVCGGRGICGRCQVTVGEGEFAKHAISSSAASLSPVDAVETRYTDKRGPLKPGRRLGCQAQILGDLVVDVPPDSQVHRQVVRKRAEAHPIAVDPVIRLYYVEVTEPDMHDPSSDFRRLAAALEAQHGLANIHADLPVLRDLQKVLRQGQWQVTAAVRRDGRIVSLRPGFADRALGRCGRHRFDHHRGASLRSDQRHRPGLGRTDEPADPVRRRPDEPGLLRHDEPGRRPGPHRRRAGGAERADRRGRRGRRRRRGPRCST